MFTAQPAADVKHGRRLIKGAAVVAPAVATRYKHGAEQRKTYLAPVDMAGEHQVHALALGPANVVRRVTQAKPEDAVRATNQVRARPEPRTFMADHHQRLTTDLDLLP